MTTFSYPIDIKRPEMDASGVGSVVGAVPVYYSVKVSVGQTGTAVGSTTIPLFVAPAGSRPFDCIVDILTASDQGASNTNLRVGTSTSTGAILAVTTVNTAGRRAGNATTGALVSANAIVFTADTTIQAIVSIDTSTLSTLDIIIHTILV